MRASVIFFAVLFGVLADSHEEKNRVKRFLNPDAFRIFPESFMKIGDIARELTDQLSEQTSMVLQHSVPQVTGVMAGMGSAARRRQEDAVKTPKRNLVRVPVGRETEGDEKEVDTFDPVKTEDPEVSVYSGGNAGFNPFIPFSFSFGLLAPWWEGPNVCEEKNEVEEPDPASADTTGMIGFNFQSTSCTPSESAYICTKKIQTNGMRKTIVVIRQCCHGNVRRTDGRPGCSALKMENLIETMRTLEMTKFLEWVQAAGLQDPLQTENYTVFAPSNDAVIDFEDDTEDNEISAINPAKRLTDVSSVVQSHIVKGYKNVDILKNEQLLDTLNEGFKIRINKYHTSQVITANCIPVNGKNNFATNGIVHLTSGVLPQTTKTVGEILESEDQFSTIKRLLEQSGLMEDLKKENQTWTIFAPTDEAFKKLPQALRRQMAAGEGCVQSILLQHLVKETICTTAVVSQFKVRNILENILQLTKDEAEKLRVEGALIDSENKMGTNGVIHAIEKVLIPSQARSMLKALEEEERTDILDLIEAADLVEELEQMENITFFVPTKEAFKSLSNETQQELRDDPEIAKKIILSHLILPNTPSNLFLDNKKFITMNGHQIHMKLHELFPGIVTAATVQCAYILSHDNQACGAIMHKINKILLPPKGNIVEVLKSMEGHDILLKLLQDTELLSKLEEDGPYTFLAPTDDAFERMDDITLDELLDNKTKAEEILRLHVLPELMCCNGVSHGSPFHRQYVRTLDGRILPLHRGLNDRVRFGRARALQCDTSATNGLIHTINRVILPRRPTFNIFGMDLFNFF